MNHYDARRLADGAGYHFTVRTDDRIWPVGYCRDHEPHATADEARECFGRYLLDGQREETYGDWTGCEAIIDGEKCDTPTKKGLTSRPPLGHGFALCDAHRTSERLTEMTVPVGRITASY